MNKVLSTLGANIVGGIGVAIGRDPVHSGKQKRMPIPSERRLHRSIQGAITYPDQDAIHKQKREYFCQLVKYNKDRFAHEYEWYDTDGLDEISTGEAVMKSITAEKLGLAHEPVAVLWSNTKPEGALQIKPHGQTCIMPLFCTGGNEGKDRRFRPGELWLSRRPGRAWVRERVLRCLRWRRG